jgi:hypothetical protein
MGERHDEHILALHFPGYITAGTISATCIHQALVSLLSRLGRDVKVGTDKPILGRGLYPLIPATSSERLIFPSNISSISSHLALCGTFWICLSGCISSICTWRLLHFNLRYYYYIHDHISFQSSPTCQDSELCPSDIVIILRYS